MKKTMLVSACASLALLSACKDASSGSSTASTLGTLASTTTTTTNDPPKNSSLINPTVQQTFTTFSANQRLTMAGLVGGDVTVVNNPDGSAPQAATQFTYGIPSDGLTIKPPAYVTSSIFYEGSQPSGAQDASVSINFNPRDAVYTVTATTASINETTRFQDPKHRTAFQQQLVPTVSNYRYAEAGSGTDETTTNARSTKRDLYTIFVRDVGTGANQTQYVTLAGYVAQHYTENEKGVSSPPGTTTVRTDFSTEISRSVFAYGLNTATKDVPKSGSATYTGDMYTHVIITPQLNPEANDFRTIIGTATTSVDFGNGTASVSMSGNVVGFAGDTRAFAASGTTTIYKPEKDTENSRFFGAINSWTFGNYNVGGGITVPTAASTIEGGFYGPNAAELGAAFRIIGNRTDERIDFLGAYVGKKN